MPQPPDLNRLLVTGVQFTKNGRSQARLVGSELAAQGRLATDQTSAADDALVARARRRNEELRQAMRGEVQRQLSRLGLATKADLAALEGRFTRVATSPTERKVNRATATTVAANKIAAKKGK